MTAQKRHIRWGRALLITLAGLILAVAILLTLLWNMDLSRFKGTVENYVSEATGREFVIGGRFEPEIGETIRLLAEDVRLANAEWGFAENILTVERLAVSIDLWSLFDGPIMVENLEVRGLEAHIEAQEETGRSAWDFSTTGDTESSPGDEEGFLDDGRLPLVVEKVRLEEIGVTYGRGWLDAPRQVSVVESTLIEGSGGLLELALSGALDQEPLTANGQIGPLPALITGRDLRWELDLELGQFQASSQGAFEDLFKLEGGDLRAQMKGPPAEGLLARLGLPPIAQGPVDINDSLRHVPEGIEAGLVGAFGNLATDITARTESLGEFGAGDFSLDVSGPDLQAIGKMFQAGFLPANPFAVRGQVTAGDGRIVLHGMTAKIGEARLVVEGQGGLPPNYDDTRLLVDASGPEIQTFIGPALDVSTPSGPYQFKGTLAGDAGVLRVEDFRARVGPHMVSADGAIGALDDLRGLDLNVNATGPDLEQIIGPWVENYVPAERYEMSARLRKQSDGYVLDDVAATVGEAQLQITGTTGVLPALAGLDAEVGFSGPDLQALLESWVEVELPAESFELRGQVRERDSALQLSEFVVSLANVRGALEGTTGTLPDLDGLKVEMHLAGPDGQRFNAALGADEVMDLPPDPFDFSGTIRHDRSGWSIDEWTASVGDDRMALDGVLGDFETLTGIDINVELSGSDLREFLPGRDLSLPLPYSASGRLAFGEDMINVQDLALKIGLGTAFVDGRIPISMQLADAEFRVQVSGPDLAQVGRTLNAPSLPGGAFRFEGALSTQGSAYVVEELDAELAGNDVRGNLRLDFEPKRKLIGRLESDNLDLSYLFPAKEESEPEAKDDPNTERLIPAAALPLQLLDFADMDVILRLRALKTETLDVGDVELKIVIEDGHLSADTGNVLLKNGGTLRASLKMNRLSETAADVDLTMVGQQFNLNPPIDINGDPISRPLLDLNLEFSGSGSTFHELAAGSNGSISVRGGEGEVDNAFGGYILRDVLSQVFSSINPFAKDSPHSNLQCLIVEIDVVDGIARTKVAGMQTDRIAAASVGTINLDTEALDVSFRTAAREGIGITVASAVNPYIKLGGTLAKPAIQLDKKRGLISGTFAVLTGGLSILAQSVWDRYLSADDLCAAVVEGLESGEIGAWEEQPTKKKRLFGN